MDWVTRQNIAKFEKLLSNAPDEKERDRLQRLLDDEREKAGTKYKPPIA